MPPFGFRKRERSSSPAPLKSKNKAAAPKKAKTTLFDTVDAPSEKQQSLEDNKKFLEELDGQDDDESSLSDADSDEFEDVPPAKRRRVGLARDELENEDYDEGEDDEMEWEDAIQQETSSHAIPPTSKPEPEITDVSISMNDDGSYIEPLVSAATGKKGPSKRERQVRLQSHCLHVQALMWHNTIRNSWLNDKQVQTTLVDGLTEGVKPEVRRWKEAIGPLREAAVELKGQVNAKAKSKGAKKGKKNSTGRDWNEAAEALDVSTRGGDPLLRLLKVLTAYWRKRFAVTSPGLRKQGYKPLRRLRDEVRAWEKDRNDFEEHGERIETVQDFRKMAKNCEGSKDVGAQLFVALLRGLGLETRMVANLQPIGFGWSKAEEADPKKDKKKNAKAEKVESEAESEVEVKVKGTVQTASSAKKGKSAIKAEKPTRKSSRGNKSDPINLDDSDSPLSSLPSAAEYEPVDDEEDDISIIDIPPSTPKKKPNRKYDRDMAFPNYWTEVRSPVSHKYYPVDPIVLSTIASNEDLLQTFEPRGKRAEKAKQVMCYTIAFSSDGTAKDVTVRYLKRHQLPGKTKGMRMPIEKMPVYNRKGKIRRYEDYDWFRTLMSLYDRPEAKRTAADDLEDQTDLKPFNPAKEEKDVAKESLQGYKQSAEYVLEQHLRREEAFLPGAEPVKYFMSGKGDKAQELPVYSRDDVVTCKTVESWHKEGRAIKVGEQPMKYVPMRAVTLIRKREMEDAQRETGEKLKQGLYAESQTDWIIPPRIQNGVIPKNAFGNMDVYVPTMVPRGAKHLPLKGSAKICKKLGIDYAEACTGFEFGKQRAVPVLTGVVVAEENVGMVRDAWRADQQEIKRKEDTKRTAAALHWWRKMLLGLRVLERMRTEYAESGGAGEEINSFIRKAKRANASKEDEGVEKGSSMELSGGFLPPGYDEEEVPDRAGAADNEGDVDAGFFADESQEEAGEEGGYLVEDDPDTLDKSTSKEVAMITPVSLQSMHKTMDGAAHSDGESDESSNQAAQRPYLTNGRKSNQHEPVAAKPRKAGGRRTVARSSDGNEDSSLSDLSDADSSDSVVATAAKSEAQPTPPPTKKTKLKSPSVVIPTILRSRSRTANKTTPVRSQYFYHDNDGDEGDEQSEDEVVKPRKTTVRTRAGG